MSTATPPRQTVDPRSVDRKLSVQIAIVEARRLALHPAVLVAAGLSLVAMIAIHWGEAPVWPRVSIGMSVSLAILGLGVVLGVADNSHRLWGADNMEAVDSLPVSGRVIAVGQALSLTAAVAIALLIQAVYTLYALAQGAVGVFQWWEMAAGPVSVAVLASAGFATARWVPSPITGPLTAISIVGVNLGLSLAPRFAWLAVIPDWDVLSNMEGPPPELSFRPIALHVGYLVAVTGGLLALAFARDGLNRYRLTRDIGVVAVFAIVAGVLGVANTQMPTVEEVDSRVSQFYGSNSEHTCTTRGLATYCSIVGYEAWVEEWASAVEPVLDAIPSTAAEPLEIRQYPQRWLDVLQVEYGYPRHGPEPPYQGEDIRTGLWWGRGAGDLETESFPFGMSLGVASWTVGLPTHPPESTLQQGIEGSCLVGDQARGVLAVWLAGQGSETAHKHVDNVLEAYESQFENANDDPFAWIGYQQPYPWYLTEFSLVHFRYADQLLHRPDDEVSALISQHWSRLIDPRSTISDAEELLHLQRIDWSADLSSASSEVCH